ncbi:TIL domain-containing protein [Caerostris extrusa]|uniref:TIL domain-containing protein n=1 Tax=Caerostris extrusa TaxID=172846 RepID=A0AAV4W6U8_CAEEX|nr:TIL domain-containing protein [Caerostris extrusa]
MRTLILFLCVAVLTATLVAAQQDQNCPANKVFGKSGDCPQSCYTVKNPGPRRCTRRLRYGCVCDQGFVLLKDKDFSSDCVKPEDCP